MRATIFGGPLDGKVVDFIGVAYVVIYELPAPDLVEMFGPRDGHPMWLYSPLVDAEKHHEFWRQYQVEVTMTPEEQGGKTILRWPKGLG